MRELARSLAWAFGLGAFALAFALFAGVGLEHADGPTAWALFAAYAPYYLLMHLGAAWPQPVFLGCVFVTQLAWFAAGVAVARRLARGTPRWLRQRAGK